jgi:hypothetical protein
MEFIPFQEATLMETLIAYKPSDAEENGINSVLLGWDAEENGVNSVLLGWRKERNKFRSTRMPKGTE